MCPGQCWEPVLRNGRLASEKVDAKRPFPSKYNTVKRDIIIEKGFAPDFLDEIMGEVQGDLSLVERCRGCSSDCSQ